MAKFCDESLFFCLCLLLLSSRLCDSVESDFTVDVEAGSVECFFQHIKKDVNFEFEYQVRGRVKGRRHNRGTHRGESGRGV